MASDPIDVDTVIAEHQVRSMEASEAAFRSFLARQPGATEAKRRAVDPSDEDETEQFYSGPYVGDAFFRYLNPKNPTRARRRIERLYWESWSRFVMAFLLSSFGALLVATGIGCCVFGDLLSRGFGVLMAGVLMCIPGFYSLYIQWGYVCCKKGFSLDQLPD